MGSVGSRLWSRRGYREIAAGDVVLQNFGLALVGSGVGPSHRLISFAAFSMLMGSHDQRVRMKQFLSDEEFREPILLHLPQNIVQDATQLVPEGVLA